MKVYYTCSTAEFKKYRDSYFAIRDRIVMEGHVLTRDWLANADERIRKGDTAMEDVREIYRACVAAIKEADIVIIEDTVSNFSTGHQITLALRARKPTLVLWQQDKNRQFSRMFIHGIESELLQVSEYTSSNIEEIIRTFINKYKDVHEENRFHLVLNGVERNYLDWLRHNTGKSRTKAIKDAIDTKLGSDQEYQKYLNRLGRN